MRMPLVRGVVMAGVRYVYVVVAVRVAMAFMVMVMVMGMDDNF